MNMLEATEYWLDTFHKCLHPRLSKEFVLESVKFILENNNLKFDNDYFNQIKGTSNGYHLCPTYVNLEKGIF